MFRKRNASRIVVVIWWNGTTMLIEDASSVVAWDEIIVLPKIKTKGI